VAMLGPSDEFTSTSQYGAPGDQKQQFPDLIDIAAWTTLAGGIAIGVATGNGDGDNPCVSGCIPPAAAQ
jgi:hypothetical protein